MRHIIGSIPFVRIIAKQIRSAARIEPPYSLIDRSTLELELEGFAIAWRCQAQIAK